MSDFKAKMHRIRFRWGSLQRSSDLLAGFQGPTSKGGKGKVEGMTGEWREEKEGEGKEEQGGERPFW